MIITLDNEWPATLPLPAIDYSGIPRNQTIYSPDVAYFVERRSRFTRSYCLLSVTWKFDDDQFELFKTFVDSLGNGTAQFKIELRFPKNTALTEWAVRLEPTYEGTYTDGRWDISAGLELISPIALG